jgi:uncharacterized SAM-binding protein YcdF (DUF218 family)
MGAQMNRRHNTAIMRLLGLAVMFAVGGFIARPLVGQSLDEQLASVDEMRDATIAAIHFLEAPSRTRFDAVRVSPGKFEAAFRASKAATSATEAGVSYKDYPAAISPLLTESAILTDLAATDDEKFLASAFTVAAKVYGTAGRYWSVMIRSGDTPGNSMSLGWGAARKVLDLANAAYLRNLKNPPPTKNRKKTKTPAA